MKTTLRLIAASCALASIACISVMPTKSGTPIDTAFVQTITKGKTTPAEIQTRLGKPTSITQSPDEIQWRYFHWEGKPQTVGTGYSKSKSQTLIVRFRNGTVFDYSLSTTDQ